MNNNQTDLSKELMVEYLRSERLRIFAILLIFFSSMIIMPFVQFFNPGFFTMALEKKEGFTAFAISASVFFLFEIAVFGRIQYMIKKRISPPLVFKYINTVIEFSLISLVLFYTVYYDQSILVMEYDGYGFFILLIILSILHLNWKVNILAGIISCCGYGIVAIWAFQNLAIPGNPDQIMMIYGARSFSLIIYGIIAAVVAGQFYKKIQKAINYRAQRKQAQQLLGQQVSDEIAGELLKSGMNDKPKIADASIMFMDIKDFSKWADSNSPEDVMSYQNAVFCPIIDIIHKNHGSIHQFLGDGFMASFGISKNNEEYVQSAFDAGLEILAKIKELEKADIIPITFIRIGLHRGNIVTGNIGNESRKQFSLAGKNIIIASRLEELNKTLGTQFLISKDIKERIEEGDYLLEECGPVKMKGIDKKIEVFKVIKN